MTKRMFIVDAMALAYRSFFAFGRPLSTSDGFPTSAIFGSAMFMNKLISEEEPDYLAVVSDTSEPTFRHGMYPEYKATRDTMPEDLSKQIPKIFELFDRYGCPAICCPGYEADDVIGSMARTFAADDLSVYIVSGDKDFYQLVDPHTFLYQPKKNETAHIVDVAGVKDKFDCRPEQVIDALALMGDKVDNVPGVPGIGEKGAAKLIGTYGSLEGIYENLDKITAKRQKEGLLKHREDAFLSRSLVTIKTDVVFGVEKDQLVCDARACLGNQDLWEFYRRYEFRQLAQKTEALLGSGPPHTTVPTPQAGNLLPDLQRDYQVVEVWPPALTKALLAQGEIAIAVPVENKDIVADSAEAVALYTPDRKGYFVVINSQTLAGLKMVFEAKEMVIVGHGTKAALQLLWNAGLDFGGTLIDTKVCDYLLDPNNNKHTLDVSAPRHGGVMRLAIEDDEFVLGDGFQNQLVRDAEATFAVYKTILPKIEEQNMKKVLFEVDMPLLPVLAKMEQQGVYIDPNFLLSLSHELDVRAKEIQRQIYEEAGEEFNINSTKQLQSVLFSKLKVHEQLGIKRLKKTKTGFSTDESVLSQLAAHPIPKLILEYRLVAKLKNTYVDTLPQHVHKKTGRLHTKLHQTVAATGRLSSDNPNLQNIPMRTALGRRIRQAFVPQSADDVLISADYSQVEIRLLAHFAQAEDIIDAFKQGLDVHRVTAAKIFGVAEDNVDDTMRSRAKAVNFGIIYGMGPQRLAAETGVSLPEAKEFIKKYFEAYPGIQAYTQQLIRRARTNGYSETITGRRRPITGINESNRAVLARAENIAINAPIQGSAADLIKLAMIGIAKRFRVEGMQARMLLQIHDELLFSSPKSQLDQTCTIIKTEMETAVTTSVPLEVKISSGSSWLEAH